MIIIGDYTNSTLASIKTAWKDYQNIIHTFNITHGYDVIFAQNNLNVNENEQEDDIDPLHITYLQNSKSNSNSNYNFKLKWTYDDIDEFNARIKSQYIENENYAFDGLVYIISSHGNDKTMYDSNGESFALEFVYHEFDNQQCRQLRNKPKIYLHDTNRIDFCNNSDTNSYDNGGSINTMKVYKNTLAAAAKQKYISDKLYNSSSSSGSRTPTYIKDTHFRKVFGHSGQQYVTNETRDWINKITQNGSIFIQSFTAVFKNGPNLTDILFDTRKFMATLLRVPRNDPDYVVLDDKSTMPYDIKFDICQNDHQAKIHENKNQSVIQDTVCALFILIICIHQLFNSVGDIYAAINLKSL